jgi:uncharacterized membrane protein YfcA
MNGVGSFFEISLIIFIATVFRTAFGFGEALIAVPLLSLLLPVKVAAPVAVLASILIALVAVIREHQHIHVSSAKRLLLATVFGLPIGLLILRYAPEGVTKGILGIFLLAFSVFSILKPNVFVLANDRLIWLFGFLAGITGGSYGMNGPPLAIYGAARGWSPHQFRATLQAYFLPASIFGMIGYYFSGVWTREVTLLFACSLPAIVIGIVFGNMLTRTMDKGRFNRFLYGGLIVVASVLLFQVFGASHF